VRFAAISAVEFNHSLREVSHLAKSNITLYVSLYIYHYIYVYIICLYVYAEFIFHSTKHKNVNHKNAVSRTHLLKTRSPVRDKLLNEIRDYALDKSAGNMRAHRNVRSRSKYGNS